MTEDDDEKNQFSLSVWWVLMPWDCYPALFPYLQKMVGEQLHISMLSLVPSRYYCSCDDIGLRTFTKERLKPKSAEKFSSSSLPTSFKQGLALYDSHRRVYQLFNGFRHAVAGYMFDYCLHGNVTIEGLIINYTVFMAFGEVTCMIFGGVSLVHPSGRQQAHGILLGCNLCLVISLVVFFIPMNPSYIWVMIAIVIPPLWVSVFIRH